MKLTVLLNSTEALQKITKCDMNVKKAYALRKFILEVDEKLKAFHEVRNDLIKKYGEEKDGRVEVKQENVEVFISEINILGEEEIEIEVPEITIDDLDGNMDTKTLIQLSYLIK